MRLTKGDGELPHPQFSISIERLGREAHHACAVGPAAVPWRGGAQDRQRVAAARRCSEASAVRRQRLPAQLCCMGVPKHHMVN